MSPKKLDQLLLKTNLPIGVRYLSHQLQLASEFKFPVFKRWKIDFAKTDAIQNSDKFWGALGVFKGLEARKKSPAIYYFDSPNNFTKEIFNAFYCSKKDSLKRDATSQNNNVCNVPEYFLETSCLYVGSVKQNLHTRLLSHLGYGHPHTGSIFLKQVLESVKKPHKIYFNYCFLESKFVFIRTLAEHEKQTELNPLLGSRKFINSEGYFLARFNEEYKINFIR